MTVRLTEPVNGLISALTVRLHYATTGLHWRYGMFLCHPSARYASDALLKLWAGNELTIEVRAPAPELFFHMLLGGIDAYFTRRWPGLRTERDVPCPTGTASDRVCPGRFPFDGLLDQRRQGADTSVRCPS